MVNDKNKLRFKKKTSTNDSFSYTSGLSESESSSASVSWSSDANEELERDSSIYVHACFDTDLKRKKLQSPKQAVRSKYKLRDMNNRHIFVCRLKTSKHHIHTGLIKKMPLCMGSSTQLHILQKSCFQYCKV